MTGMPISPRWFIALAALAASAGAAAQPVSVQRTAPGAVATARPVPLNPPSNIELQLRINQLDEKVSDLTAQITEANEALRQVKALLVEFRQVDDERYRRMRATLMATCKLLYQHHWAPNGAHPTPGNPYVPDDYCRSSPDYIPLPY